MTGERQPDRDGVAESQGDVEMSDLERVIVWDKPYDVSVHQRSKSVWVASGDYLGKPVSVTDRTRTSALKRWREAAQYRGN